VFLLVAVWSTPILAVQGEGSEGAYQNAFYRHNFGYLLKRKSEIYVATYQAGSIFHLNLPDWRVAFRDLDYDCRVHYNASIIVACSQLRYVLNAVKQARNHVQTHVRDQLRRIYEVIEDILVRARGRARRGFLTNSLGKSTELATKNELHHVNHFLEEIEKGLYEAAKFWGKGTNSLVVACKVELDRLNNAFEILDEFRTTIREIQSKFVQIRFMRSRGERYLQALMMLFLSNNTVQMFNSIFLVLCSHPN